MHAVNVRMLGGSAQSMAARACVMAGDWHSLSAAISRWISPMSSSLQAWRIKCNQHCRALGLRGGMVQAGAVVGKRN